MINYREGLKKILPRSLLIRSLKKEFCRNRSILLTFDDGPHPEITLGVLDILEEYSVEAIFFVVGKMVEKAPNILTEIIRRGHEIGNHSFIHNNPRPPSFLDNLKDIRKCQDLIKKYTGESPRWFRPPLGHLSPSFLLISKLLSLNLINWSLGMQDWQCRSKKEAANAANAILERVKAGDIILLHDDNPSAIDILNIILPKLKDRGFVLDQGIHALK